MPLGLQGGLERASHQLSWWVSGPGWGRGSSCGSPVVAPLALVIGLLHLPLFSAPLWLW